MVVKIFSSFCFSFFISYISAQQFKITDIKGNGISYVSVGISNTDKGTVSDEKGFLEFRGLKNADTLVFNHLNFKRKKFVIDFNEINSTDTINIILIENVFSLKEVTVTGKNLKTRVIKNKGVLFPGGSIIYENSEHKHGSLGEEYGEIINKKRDFIVRQLNITCLKNSIDTCIFRFNLYLIKNDSAFTPLLPKPVYITFLKSDKKVRKSVELNNYIPKGRIWVGLEIVKYVGKGSCLFPLSFSNGYGRISNSNKLEKLPMGLGHFFSIKGYYVDSN